VEVPTSRTIRLDVLGELVSVRTIRLPSEEMEAFTPVTARAVRRKRFGAAPPSDFRERARQARFLEYRGFDGDQIRAALGRDDRD